MLILFVCVLVGCHDRLSFSSRLISFTVALQSACFQKNETGFEIILSLVFMALHDIAVIRVSKTESVNSKIKKCKIENWANQHNCVEPHTRMPHKI